MTKIAHRIQRAYGGFVNPRAFSFSKKCVLASDFRVNCVQGRLSQWFLKFDGCEEAKIAPRSFPVNGPSRVKARPIYLARAKARIPSKFRSCSYVMRASFDGTNRVKGNPR